MMSKKGYLKHNETIKAWANGREVQWRHSGNRAWIDTPSPAWGESTEYRIKPEPKILKGWVNVYKDGSFGNLRKDRETADLIGRGNYRISCIYIEQEYKEGEGLDT